MSTKRFSCVLALGVLLALAGCAPDWQLPLGKICGAVTYNGEPLPAAQIVFYLPGGRSATGRIEDGQILDVTTYYETGDGAPLGTLIVTIHQILEAQDFPSPQLGQRQASMPKPPFPARYSNPDQSGLEADVQPGLNEFTFELTD